MPVVNLFFMFFNIHATKNDLPKMTRLLLVVLLFLVAKTVFDGISPNLLGFGVY